MDAFQKTDTCVGYSLVSTHLDHQQGIAYLNIACRHAEVSRPSSPDPSAQREHGGDHPSRAVAVHRLIHPESGTIVNHPEWEWADLDRKRLVCVSKGVLHAAKIHSQGLGDVKMLHDFNDMALEAIAAPY